MCPSRLPSSSIDISKKKLNVEKNLKQLIEMLKAEYFPKYEVDVMTLLFQMVGHGLKSYRKPVLMMMKLILPFVNMKQPKLAQFNVSFIGILFGLLKGDCSEEALEVLELVVQLSGIERFVCNSPVLARMCSYFKPLFFFVCLFAT